MEDEPWLKRHEESDVAYACFRDWLDMPDRIRSARLLHEQRSARGQAGPDFMRIRRFRTAHEWVARADAYDAYLDRAAVAALVRQREAAGKRHARIALAMQAKIIERLQRLNLMELTPRDLATWLRVTVEVERTALGMETAQRVEVSGPGGGPVELAAVRELSTDDRRTLLAEAVRTASERLDRLRVVDDGN